MKKESASSGTWTDYHHRKLKGLTQSELAQNVGLSRTHISNIEAPQVKTSLSLESLFDIADALDVPVKDFFDFSN